MIDLSSYAKTLDNKAVAVFGLGLSGLSTVKALRVANIKAIAWDDNEESKNKAEALGADIKDLTKIDLSDFAALILSPGVPYTFEPHAVVENANRYNLEIIGDIEVLYRNGLPCKTIGITGTNGKSTTTALMAHVLNECGVKTQMAGNIGTPVFELDLKDIDALVLEISSYQMDLCPSFRPDISMLLNITPDHLDRHGSLKNYAQAKANILGGNGLGLVSVDDDFSQSIFDRVFLKEERKTIPISMKLEIPEGIFVKDNILYQNHLGENKKIFDVGNFETLKGQHNHQNITFVYRAAKEFNLNDENILKAIASFSGLPHRQYLVLEKDNISYINDSKATNAEAAAKALSSYDNIFWIVGGRAKEGGLNGLEIFKDKIVKTYVIGECAQEFGQWLLHHGFGFEINETLEVAVPRANQDAQKFSKEHNQKSVVLLSPATASWDQFKSFEDRGDAFSKLVEKTAGKKS